MSEKKSHSKGFLASHDQRIGKAVGASAPNAKTPTPLPSKSRLKRAGGWLTGVGAAVSQVFRPAVAKDTLPRQLNLFDSVDGVIFETVHRRRNGTFFPVEVSGRHVEIDGRSFNLGVYRDITERKQAEEALVASELRYRRLFESARDGILILDAETGMVVDVNPFLIGKLGFSREQFLGKAIWDLGFFKDIVANQASFAELQRQDYVRYKDKPLEAADGRRIDVEFVSNVYLVNHRRVIQCNIRDITERKQLEERFLHAQQLESIGMLAAGIAPDLNNVLAPILIIGSLLRPSLSSARDLEMLNMLEHGARRGAALVKQILGFAQSNTGEFQPIQVKTIADDVISVIEQTFPKSIQLEPSVPPGLWAVPGNATQIHQVLLNLCVNARDAMPQGGTLRIAVANRRLDAAEAAAIPGARLGTWLVLEVGDTGTGIAPEMLSSIWTPFFTTKGAGKGTGLGLSTIRSIVANHGGFVDLDTEVGRGSTFRVFLPAVENELSQPRDALHLRIPDGHGELILVVEDEASIRNIVATVLGQHGYRVLSCGNGFEAIALFNTQSAGVSLVITDLDMPKLGGVALANALMQIRPGLRLLVMSGGTSSKTDSSTVAEAHKLAHAFLPKPFSSEALLDTVHRLLYPAERSLAAELQPSA